MLVHRLKIDPNEKTNPEDMIESIQEIESSFLRRLDKMTQKHIFKILDFMKIIITLLFR